MGKSSITAQHEANRLWKEQASKLPVDLKAICSSHKITIAQESLEDDISAMLIPGKGGASIVINKDHHPTRQRFSIAHELGHYFLHSKTAKVFIDSALVFFRDQRASDGTDIHEIEANTFAAELLMPKDALKDFVSQKPIDPFDDTAIKNLAKKFDVSPQALLIRLTTLDLVRAWNK